MTYPVSLSTSNFFTQHILEPCSVDLSPRARSIALIASIALGILMIGLAHLYVRLFLYNPIKHTVRVSTTKLEAHLTSLIQEAIGDATTLRKRNLAPATDILVACAFLTSKGVTQYEDIIKTNVGLKRFVKKFRPVLQNNKLVVNKRTGSKGFSNAFVDIIACNPKHARAIDVINLTFLPGNGVCVSQIFKGCLCLNWKYLLPIVQVNARVMQLAKQLSPQLRVT